MSQSTVHDPGVAELRVQIVRYLDDSFPGFVECVFEDASGTTHAFVDKVPIDDTGRAVVRIDTDKPWGIESKQGETCFVVSASQLSRITADG